MRRNVDEEVEDCVESVSDLWVEEPLDGDETEEVANKILQKLDQMNGND